MALIYRGASSKENNMHILQTSEMGFLHMEQIKKLLANLRPRVHLENHNASGEEDVFSLLSNK